MSSVAFPPLDHSSSSPTDDSQYYQPPFDPSSSFQMNPLSSHPPRTPRTSIISTNSHLYDSTVFDTKDDPQEQVLVVDDQDEHDHTPKSQEAESKIRKEAVWREMFLTSDGRDKAFVSPRTYLPCLCLTFHLQEINAIFDPSLIGISFFHHHKHPFAAINTPPMGA